MSIRIIHLLFSAIVLSLAVPLSWAAPSEDEQAILDNYRVVSDTYAKRDARGAMSRHIKDDSLVVFDVVKPFEDPGYDRNLVKTQNFMDATTGPLIIEYQDIRVTVDKNIAFTTYKVRIVATGKEGQKIDLVARGTHGLKKINGQWLFVVEHNSMPQDWKMDL